MDRRPLGSTGLTVCPLAVGTWAMGGYAPSWGHVDDNESIATLQLALDAGINLIDTAPIYGAGHAETIVGKAIQGRREECLIATKCGMVLSPSTDEPPHRCLRRESVLHECEESLRRLRVEVIDLYQCHWPDPETPIGETMEALVQLLEQGKIRAIGLSNFSCEQIAAAREHGPVHEVQLPFSMIHRQAAQDLLPYCVDHQLGTLAYSPLAKGLLTGKFREDTEITGVRASDPEFRGQRYRDNLWKVARLREIARGHGCTMAQLALHWVFTAPGVTAAICGAKRPSQLQENLGALGLSLGEDVRGRVSRILEES